MSQKSFMPRTDLRKAVWIKNIADNIDAFAVKYGISDEEKKFSSPQRLHHLAFVRKPWDVAATLSTYANLYLQFLYNSLHRKNPFLPLNNILQSCVILGGGKVILGGGNFQLLTMHFQQFI